MFRRILSREPDRTRTIRQHRFLHKLSFYLPKPRLSKTLNTCLSKALFFDIDSIESTLGNTKGKGEDLFLLSLLMTCLKVYRYPTISHDVTPTTKVGKWTDDADGFIQFFEETLSIVMLSSRLHHFFTIHFSILYVAIIILNRQN